VYEIKPEYKRFVGLAGADENLISISRGSNLAKYPSVIFKIFIDGQQASASPVMRVLSPARVSDWFRDWSSAARLGNAQPPR
jgi:hypothetical protein